MLLHHGTTRERAEAIEEAGPSPNFCEPGGGPAEGFHTARAEGPFDHGSPETYARNKAAIFAEGGPAILEFILPDDLAASIVAEVGVMEEGKADNLGAEISFYPGYGLEQLRAAWPTLAKRVIPLEGQGKR